MAKIVLHSHSPTDTFKYGKRLGKKLSAGSVIALIGELGSGKTLFTRGICAGAGVLEKYVNSPTFAFVNEYPGKLTVYHMDLYRLDTIDEVFEIGILDYLTRAETGIMVVEWAEKIAPLLSKDCLEIKFHVLPADRRKLELRGSGKKYHELFEERLDR